MPRRNEFVTYVCELLAPLGPIRSRAMFGGWGLYCDERFFGIVIADTLYLKADGLTRETFVNAGQKPFTFVMRGKQQQMSYYTVPAEALEDFDEMRVWAQLALAAAGRAAAKKTPPPFPSPASGGGNKFFSSPASGGG